MTIPVFFGRWALRIVCAILYVVCFSAISTPVQAATTTVCASGCDYTSITDAFDGTGAGNIVAVGASYSSSSETFPLLFPVDTTVDCQNSGAVIGRPASPSQVDIVGVDGMVLKNCQLSQTNITSLGAITDMTIAGNTFSNQATTTIDILHAVSNIAIVNNANITALELTGVTSGTIRENTFYNRWVENGRVVNIVHGTSVQMGLNQIEVYSTAVAASGGIAAFTDVVNFTFSTNTISYPLQDPSVAEWSLVGLSLDGVRNAYVHDNYINVSANRSGLVYPNGILILGTAATSSVDVFNNTIFLPSRCVNCVAFQMFDRTLNNTTSTHDVFATSTYNLLVDSSRSTSTRAFYLYQYRVTSTFSLFNEYNGVVDFGDVRSGNVSLSLSTTTRSQNPQFKTKDADVSNDLELAPYSDYLDVNGSRDVGAYTGTRIVSFLVDPTGTVDYSSIHATSVNDVIPHLRNNDTVSLSAGTHPAFTVASTSTFTGNVTFAGVGAATIVQATSSGSALVLQNITTSTFRDMTFQNASSTVGYFSSRQIYSYGGVAYDDGEYAGGESENTYFFVSASACNINFAEDEFTELTSVIGDATDDWHLALVAVDGVGHITVLVPDHLYATPSAFNADCGENGILVDRWVTSTFSASGGEYVYNSAAVSAAGVALIVGTNPPIIERRVNAGIRLVGSHGNTFVSVTSTGNGYGIWFNGTSTNNTVSSTVFSGNTTADVRSDGSGENYIKNTSFNRVSSLVMSTGLVHAYYRVRARVLDALSAAVSGAAVSFRDAGLNALTAASTGVDGYTPYTDDLFAYTMSSSSIALTNGGYNPYTISVAAVDDFGATSTSELLSTPNQTITLVMAEAEEDPVNTPGAPVLGSLSTSAVTITIDTNENPSDTTYAIYSSVLGGYIAAAGRLGGGAVWQTSSTWGASFPVVGLSCGTSYTFTVKARSAGLTESSFSSPASISTSVCPASGGGLSVISPSTQANQGSSMDAQPSIPVFMDVTLSVDVIQDADRLAALMGTVRDHRAEQRIIVLVESDTKAFRIKATPMQLQAMAHFVAYGISPATVRLGEGERRAVLRDYLETVGRADVVWSDLERIATGFIPVHRNLTKEQGQVTRILQNFRLIFDTLKPNFQDPIENMVWNRLMYRIRTSERDLGKEREGIIRFKGLYGRLPKTPMEWTIVRALGYDLSQ